MSEQRIGASSVLLVALPAQEPGGREQEGLRPAVVVGVPEQAGTPRFPVSIVVPLTTRGGSWAEGSPELYPRLRSGSGGLQRDSVALLDQVRSLDVSRVRGYLGRLEKEEFDPMRAGLRRVFGFDG